jgi:SagB-type dehydrogenase family enzyme
MTISLSVSEDAAIVFRDGVHLESDGDEVRLAGPHGSFALGRTTPGIRSALRALAGPPVRLAELAMSPGERVQMERIAERIGHLLARCVLHDGRELARIEATARGAGYRAAVVPADASVRLSRFAFCRSRDDRLVLESPLAKHRVTLVDPVARAMVAELAGPRTAAELPSQDLLAQLVGAGFVETGADGFASDADPTLRQWDFHDLLFHSRSRPGRYDDPFGGIFPYQGEIEPQPAVKPVPDGPAVELPRPSWNQVVANDSSLATVMEARTSIRQYGDEPMTLDQLGEFLYRVARVRSRYGPGDGVPYEVAARPFPCGGGAYELELYLTVRRCAGLAEGIYYYDPVGHRLVLVNSDDTDRRAMLYVASVATAMQANPDVLITITSRFQRLSWKYRAIAYAVTLRHTGVLYQTMYLVATAMGLAPCGLGSGDSDLAARVLGLNYTRESSVGDFILGSHPGATGGHVPANWAPVNDPGWALLARDLLS